VKKLNLNPIAPFPFSAGSLYRPITFSLYNTYPYLFTLCEASRGYFRNLARPIWTHFTDRHFTRCHSMCLLVWNLDPRLLIFESSRSPSVNTWLQDTAPIFDRHSPFSGSHLRPWWIFSWVGNFSFVSRTRSPPVFSSLGSNSSYSQRRPRVMPWVLECLSSSTPNPSSVEIH
jgi:hypothetical protein